jgi:3-oxoacyl-[acyl-carrier protein] reductase
MSKKETPTGCALVTGAARGIGAASALALARQNPERPICINYGSDAEGAAQTVAAIEEIGGRAIALQGDVSDRADVERLVTEAAEKLEGPVLVMRADGLLRQIGDEDWQRVLDVNLTGAYNTIHATLGAMLRSRWGRIVNIASVVGPRANAGQANYAASKAGLIGLTKTVAVEVARRGITVNAVAPGLVQTKLTEDLEDGSLLEKVPAKRPGEAEEIAACVAFLASDGASYVTGTTLTVDGGLSA